MKIPRRQALIAALAGGLLVSTGLATPTWAAPIAATAPQAAAATANTPRATTLPAEARRLRHVKTPKADWFDCADTAECATVMLPRDYDDPKGAKVEVSMAKIAAGDPSRRIGTLFVNPGGPGGSGVELALAAQFFLPQDVLDRYDIVGFDPRGMGSSSLVKCFSSLKTQTRALGNGLKVPFPVTPNEIDAYQASARALAKGCSTYGKKMSGAVSTTEVARDMEMLRRVVGDRQLHYLGFSYGTYLGEVYAALFPDRVGSMVIDGVLDPTAWAGTRATASTPMTTRLRSGEGAWRAVQEGMNRCTAAGPEYCATLAYDADALHGFETAAELLKEQPIPDLGLDYASFVNMSLGVLYYTFGSEIVDQITAQVLASYSGDSLTTRLAARQQLRATVASVKKQTRNLLGFPYNNGLDHYASVMCTDGRNPSSPSAWAKAAQGSAATAPYFGEAWTWSSAWCATKNWTVKDEDVYRGSFRVTTHRPALVIGNYYDPATNYDNAVATSNILAGSRLLSSDSWGHTATGTSQCVTDALTTYLVDGTLPEEGTVCTGDYQPFQTPLVPPDSGTGFTSAQKAAESNRIPVNSLAPSRKSLGAR